MFSGFGFTNFLRHFSSNFSLCYALPTAAIIIIGLYYLLRRSSVETLMGPRAARFARGFLLAPLLAAALLAAENYRATDYYRFESYLNAYEFYHYYIGTKYAREVGYTDMYAASLVADSETGMKWKHSSNTIRDLATGRHVNSKQALDNAEAIKAKFSPERWEEFKKDIVWFKGRLVQYRWDGILRDKGYNGTPVWSMLVGGLLSNRISTDSDAGMMFLALLDPLLILIAFFMVMWAFGPRTAFLMIVLLGTHYMMKWWHMKGAYLRTDWAMCLVMATCLIRKEHYATAGALTAYAFLSRIFPAVLLFGIGAKFFWSVLDLGMAELRVWHGRLEIWRRPLGARRTIYATALVFLVALVWGSYGLVSAVAVPFMGQGEYTVSAFFTQLVSGAYGYSPMLHLFTLAAWAVLGILLTIIALRGLWDGRLDRRCFYFMAAFALTAMLLIGASSLYWMGTDYLDQYQTKIGRHSEEISTWRVGYKYVFMADFGENFSFIEKPIKEWQPRVRSDWYRDQQETWWRVQFWILALTLLACAGLKGYRAYLVGFVPLFFLVAPTYYYYIMLLTPLLFFAPRLEHGRYAAGLCLMYITGMSGFWFYGIWKQDYGTYYWLSVQIMVMVLYMLFLAFSESMAHFAEIKKSGGVAPEDAIV